MEENLEITEKKDGQEKFFDVVHTVDVKEAIGTFFLGLLSIFLFLELRRSQKRYEALLRQIAKGEIDS